MKDDEAMAAAALKDLTAANAEIQRLQELTGYYRKALAKIAHDYGSQIAKDALSR